MSVTEAVRPTGAKRAAGKRRVSGEDAVAWVILGLALLISIGPMLYLVSLSFMDNQQIFSGKIIAWPIHPENYPAAWVQTRIGALYWNSIYISTISMVLTVAISAFAGYGLGRLDFWGKNYIYALILIGLTIPLQIALIPLFVNLRWLGLMNTPLALIGPYTAFGLAFGTYIMKAFFQELPKELEDAARIDGASEFRIFWQIMLPLTRPALATIGIFLFLQNWNEFLFALTFVTDASMRTLPTGIYALISTEFYGNYMLLAAALVLFSLPVLILYFIFQQQFIEGLTAGALKH